MYKVIDDELKDEIYSSILRWWGLSHRFAKFPSPLPVSMSFEELQSIGREMKEWFVSQKTDGQHYIYYIGKAGGKEIQAIMDRQLTIHVVSFQLIKGKGYHMGTVMEGEWMEDEFYVFDLIASAGRTTRYLRFTDRQKILHQIIPCIEEVSGSPFRLVAKRFFPVSHLPIYLKEWKAEKSDGLIFVYNKHPLIPKSHSKLLKWKPAHFLTVDFYLARQDKLVQFMVVEDDKPVIFAEEPHSLLKLKEEDYESIWECKYANHWVPIRQRKDKTFPNSKYVAQKTWAHILDNVSLPIVCDYLFPNISLQLSHFH